jgi:hypothetical protein
MPIYDILCLVGIISAFVAFGVALAWGDYQTRSIDRSSKEAADAASSGGRASLVLVETTDRTDPFKDSRRSAVHVFAAEELRHRTGTEQTTSRLG